MLWYGLRFRVRTKYSDGRDRGQFEKKRGKAFVLKEKFRVLEMDTTDCKLKTI